MFQIPRALTLSVEHMYYPLYPPFYWLLLVVSMIDVALLQNYVSLLLLLLVWIGGKRNKFSPPLPGQVVCGCCCVPPLFLFGKRTVFSGFRIAPIILKSGC